MQRVGRGQEIIRCRVLKKVCKNDKYRFCCFVDVKVSKELA